MRRSLILVLVAAVAATGARAQGALGVQGYGYPTGQLGAAARAVGGATAEVDPASLLNPAALAMPSRFSIAMQFEPEFRRTTIGRAEATSSTMRFPTFLATGGVGRFTGGVSFSTFLDRTWENVYADSQVIAGAIVPSTLSAASRGAITDARFAVAYILNAKIQVGLALQSLAFAVLFGTGLIAVGLWGVLTLKESKPAPAGTLGAAGILLMILTIGGPLVASLAAYGLMAPIRSHYRRGGLAIVAGFATVALAGITTMPINNASGRSGLLVLGAACALLCLAMAWLVRRSAAVE